MKEYKGPQTIPKPCFGPSWAKKTRFSRDLLGQTKTTKNKKQLKMVYSNVGVPV
jgi:hypothetical protein